MIKLHPSLTHLISSPSLHFELSHILTQLDHLEIDVYTDADWASTKTD